MTHAHVWIKEWFGLLERGDAERLPELLQMEPNLVYRANEVGLTPLGYAAHFGHAEVASLLIAHGADVNEVSNSLVSNIPSNTALHAAIAGARNVKVMELLLQHQARTDIIDSNSHTCLHTAAFHDDNEAIIQLLLAHGADVHAATVDGETAYTIACKQGNHRVAAFLLQNGAVG